jgi:fluoroquinolone resistance protein
MSIDIWQQLVRGKLFDAAGIPAIHGRLDLRNLHVAEPRAVETLRMPRMDVTVLDGITSIEGVTWQSIDFTDSQLPGLRFSDCQIRNCIFDRCRLDDMRVWSTDFASVSFRFTDLRGTVLGGTTDNDNRRNTFHDCDFTAADMRGSIYGAAEFLRCKFNRAKLDKVDFQSSAFVDCSFEGELRDVVFCRKGFDCERFPPNEMKRVGLRRAKLRGTTFMGLDLDEVLFPEDEDHIVVDDFPQILDLLLAHFGRRSDIGSRVLVAGFKHDKKWLGPRQKVGVLNKHDLLESGGEDGLETVLKIIGPARRRPRGGGSDC